MLNECMNYLSNLGLEGLFQVEVELFWVQFKGRSNVKSGEMKNVAMATHLYYAL